MSRHVPFDVALRSVCPRCRRGRLFRGLLTVVDTCDSCGLDLRGHDSGDGPAVLVIMLLGAIVVTLVFWVEFRFEPPFWVHAVLWLPVTLGLAIVMLRFLKGLLIAMQFIHRSTALGPTDGGP